ncbi:MAG: ABC transporter substrate-binding protein [Oligoflexia bacterium]|nr:ABC transporter substrate-binding protein [Oligoflexia bacterium]
MRIVSLAPFLTEDVYALGLGQFLVAVSRHCYLAEDQSNLPRITYDASAGAPAGVNLIRGICDSYVDLSALKNSGATHILTSLYEEKDSDANSRRAIEQLAAVLPDSPKILPFFPRTLEQVLSALERLGKVLQSPKGHDVSQRLKAQLMDWGDNFYERMKNKRVTFISSVQPLMLAGMWVPDLIQACSAVSQVRVGGSDDARVEWKDILDFRPDVIIVAPRNSDLMASMRNFKLLEKFPEWESLPAVKRGEVIFTDGLSHFYSPSPVLRESMSILVSAIAGFESGYISPRDSFQRLRWLEMQRHKI